MKWQKKAEEAIARVPFFVRKRVRKRVEEEAALRGDSEVGLQHVEACQQKFLRNMEDEIRGFQVEQCFGANGCPNQAVPDLALAQRLETILFGKDLKGFLKTKVEGPLRMHHQFRISISGCPNACSRPQIVDIGLIGARRPAAATEPCQKCGACEKACMENAVSPAAGEGFPLFDYQRCVSCGQCIDVCPSGSIKESRGYRVLIGGRLGRHPQLGVEQSGIFSHEEIIGVVERCLGHYLMHNIRGERFGEVLSHQPLDLLHPPSISGAATKEK